MIIILFEITFIVVILIRHLQQNDISVSSLLHCFRFNPKNLKCKLCTDIWIIVYMAKSCSHIFLSPSWTFCFHPPVARVWISQSIVQVSEVHAPLYSNKDPLYLPYIDPILDPHKCPWDEFRRGLISDSRTVLIWFCGWITHWDPYFVWILSSVRRWSSGVEETAGGGRLCVPLSPSRLPLGSQQEVTRC